MRMWKQILILVVLGGVGYAAYSGYQHYVLVQDGGAGKSQHGGGKYGGGDAATVETVVAETRPIRDIVEAVGTTRAIQSVEIVPEASGRIEEIAFEAGQSVTKGAVLIRLDNAIAKADVAEAQARLLERDSVQKRVGKLRDTNAVALAAMEEAVARLAEAQAELDRAQQRLSERVIRAPFDGVLGLSEVDLGARVNPDTVITRLDDLSAVEVEFSLPETRFAQIKPGLKITGTSAAFGDEVFTGRIDAVDSRIDPVGRSFRVRAVIPNPHGILPSGMFMSLDLMLSETQTVTIPEEALLFQGEETYLYTVTDGKAVRQVVKTGKRQDGVVAITDGLEAGTQVVIRGLHRVRDGGAVEILGAAKQDNSPEKDSES